MKKMCSVTRRPQDDTHGAHQNREIDEERHAALVIGVEPRALGKFAIVALGDLPNPVMPGRSA